MNQQGFRSALTFRSGMPRLLVTGKTTVKYLPGLLRCSEHAVRAKVSLKVLLHSAHAGEDYN